MSKMFISTDFSQNELTDNDFTDVNSVDGENEDCDEPCNGCGKLLSPDLILKCPCSNALYCSTLCQAKDWPVHQTRCSAASMQQSVEICSNCRRTSTTLCVCRCGKTYYCDRRCQKKHWHRHAHMCACRVQKNQVGYTRPTANKAVQAGGDFDDCAGSFAGRKVGNQSFSNGGTPIIVTGPMAGLSSLVSGGPSQKKLGVATTSSQATSTLEFTSATANATGDSNGLTPSKSRNPLAMLLRSTTAFKNSGGGAAAGDSSAETSTTSLLQSSRQQQPALAKGMMAKVNSSGNQNGRTATTVAGGLPSFGDDAEADDFTIELSSAQLVQNKSRIGSVTTAQPHASANHQLSFRQRASSVNFAPVKKGAGPEAENETNPNLGSHRSSKENLLESTTRSAAGSTGSRRASTVLKFCSKNPYVSNDADSPRDTTAVDSPRRASVTMETLLSVHPANNPNPMRRKSPTAATTPSRGTGGGSFLQRNQFNSVNMSMNKIGIPNALAVAVYEDLDDPWVNLPMGAKIKDSDVHGRKLGRRAVLIVRK
ncbi:zinc finger protein, putative [Bodo saltans]|uniref:Zinc finger protein, putative n=1 Tax=Bodo saltans TaxID=75058 RepID=A0A0S4IUN7_BODSA|nr:zinc finger protein, putative [Bodo saltans]|eukprot:CUF38965.1 zinc finger protein, putative [Bodo saltans]